MRKYDGYLFLALFIGGLFMVGWAANGLTGALTLAGLGMIFCAVGWVVS